MRCAVFLAFLFLLEGGNGKLWVSVDVPEKWISPLSEIQLSPFLGSAAALWATEKWADVTCQETPSLAYCRFWVMRDVISAERVGDVVLCGSDARQVIANFVEEKWNASLAIWCGAAAAANATSGNQTYLFPARRYWDVTLSLADLSFSPTVATVAFVPLAQGHIDPAISPRIDTVGGVSVGTRILEAPSVEVNLTGVTDLVIVQTEIWTSRSVPVALRITEK